MAISFRYENASKLQILYLRDNLPKSVTKGGVFMSSRVVTYGKKLGFILAGVLLATAPVISSVAWGAVVPTRGVANPGFNPNGRGINRAAPCCRAFNPPATTFNLPASNSPAVVSPAVPAVVSPAVPAVVSPAVPTIVAPSPSPVR